MDSHEDAKLNEFTKDEWWLVAQKAKPGITREEFDRQWDEAMAMKSKKQKH